MHSTSRACGKAWNWMDVFFCHGDWSSFRDTRLTFRKPWSLPMLSALSVVQPIVGRRQPEDAPTVGLPISRAANLCLPENSRSLQSVRSFQWRQVWPVGSRNSTGAVAGPLCGPPVPGDTRSIAKHSYLDVRRRIICESFSAIYEWRRISLCSTIVCCRGLRPKTTVC